MDYDNTIKTIDNDLKLISQSIKELGLIETSTGADYNSIQHAIKNMKKLKADLEELKANISWEQPARYIKKMVETATSHEHNDDCAKENSPTITCVTKNIDNTPINNTDCYSNAELNK